MAPPFVGRASSGVTEAEGGSSLHAAQRAVPGAYREGASGAHGCRPWHSRCAALADVMHVTCDVRNIDTYRLYPCIYSLMQEALSAAISGRADGIEAPICNCTARVVEPSGHHGSKFASFALLSDKSSPIVPSGPSLSIWKHVGRLRTRPNRPYRGSGWISKGGGGGGGAG